MQLLPARACLAAALLAPLFTSLGPVTAFLTALPLGAGPRGAWIGVFAWKCVPVPQQLLPVLRLFGQQH